MAHLLLDAMRAVNGSADGPHFEYQRGGGVPQGGFIPLEYPAHIKLMDMVPDEMKPFVPEHWENFRPVNPMWHYLIGFLYIMIGSVSISGNFIVLLIFSKFKTLRTPANLFVMNLAFSDLMMNFTQFPASIFNSFSGGTWMLGGFACEIYGFCGALFGYCSIVTLSVVAYDRYNVIVKSFSGSPMTHGKAVALILLCWAWSLGWALPPFFGWCRYVPEGILTSCSFDYLDQDWNIKSYIICCFVFEYCFPLLMIMYCYFFIVRAVCEHEKQLREQAKKMNVESLRSNQDAQKASAEIRIAKVALVNISLWVTAWTPYAAIVLTGVFGDQMIISPLVSALPAMFAKTASVYNPIVYAISHPKYRQALQKTIPWMCVHEPDDKSDTASNASATTVAQSEAGAKA